MKRLVAVLAAIAFLRASLPAPAQDTSALDFVRGLRTRQYPDLALEYLERLRAGRPTPDLAALIPLEMAKARLDLAVAETDGNRRLDLYQKARSEFDEFIRKNPSHALLAEARLEVARVAILQAKTQLGRALRQDSLAAALNDAAVARRMFADANGQLKGVADQLDKRLADPKFADAKGPTERAEKAVLEQARLQAELDLGLNFIDQAQTYLDESKEDVLLERAKVVQKALPLLEQLATRDPKSPICWQARAWLGYAYFEVGDPKKARAKLGEVIDTSDAVTLVGKRLARYFRMQVIDKAPEKNDGDKRQTVREAAERWLNDYRTAHATPEGCGVRYLLAKALSELGAEQKDRFARGPLFNRARDLCRDLERTENDFTEKARLIKIALFKADGGDKSEVGKLATFDDCLLRAQFEAAQVNEVARKKDATAEEVEKERKVRLDNAVAALQRGLVLAREAGGKVAQGEVDKARALLTGYYLFTGRPQEAIDVGEATARARPATSHTANAAVYVLQAYSDLINAGLRDGTPLADLETDGTLQKMRDLAEYVEKAWPGEQAGDVARHQRGLLLLKEKKNAEAVRALSGVSPRYPGTVFVRYQLAMAAFQAAQDLDAQARSHPDGAKRAEATKAQADFESRGVEALRTLPPLPPGADGLTAGTFLQAKIELGRVLYREKKYDELEKLADPLLAALDRGELRLDGEARRGEARANLVLLKLYARYGLAEAELTAGRPARVKEVLDPIVDAIQKGEYAELKKNPALRWGLMGLALRVNIQEGNTARAREVLQAVQKLAADDEGATGNQAVLHQLVALVEKQVREVRKKDPALYDKTVASFGSFLDQLVAGQAAPSPEFLRVLADAYAGLELHDKAIEFARRVPEPKGEAGQPPEPRKLGTYRYARLLAVRELRLANKLDEAEAALKEVRETPWGKDHFEAEKERIHLLAARGKPGAAYSEWNKLVSNLVRKIAQPGVKDQYFECYYHLTDCYLKYALSLPAGPKRDEGVRRAASFVTKLEANYPDLGGEDAKARFDDLLEREPLLKRQYEALKDPASSTRTEG